MNKYKKLTSNTLVFAIGQFSSKLLSFFLVPFFTYILSTKQYGIIDTISTTVSLATPIFTLIISEGVMRFCLDARSNNDNILSIGLFISICGTIILTAFYPITYIFKSVQKYFIWFILNFASINICNVLLQYLKGTERTKFYAVCGILSTAFTLTLNILFLAVFRLGVTGYMLSIIISHLLITALICAKIKIWHKIKNPFQIQKNTYREILKYTCPMIPNSISWWVSNSSDRYMLLAFTSASVLGIYSVSYKISTILSVISTIFMGAWQISAVDDFGTDNSKKFFENIYTILLTVLFFFASLLICLSKFLGLILYQKEFFEAWHASSILIMAFVFQSLSAFLGTIYTSAKKTKMLFYSTILAATVNIIFNYVSIPKYGMYGAAGATLLSYISVWLIRAIDSKKLLDFNKHNAIVFAMLFLTSIQIIMVNIDRPWSWVISTIIFTTISVISYNLLKKLRLIETIILNLKSKIRR